MRHWGAGRRDREPHGGSLRTPVTLYAGASAYPWRAYLLFSLLGAVLHVGVWQTLLWRFGPEILQSFEHMQAQVLPYLLVAAVLIVLLLVLKRRRAHDDTGDVEGEPQN